MKHLKKTEAYVGGILLAVMTVVMASEVVMRYFVGHSLIWAEELVRYLFIWFIFLGSAYCIPVRQHITVDLLVQVLPEKVAHGIECITTVLWTLLCGVMTYLTASYTMTVFLRGEVSTALHVPMWAIYLAMPTGFFLMTVRLIIVFYQDYLKKKPDKTEQPD